MEPHGESHILGDTWTPRGGHTFLVTHGRFEGKPQILGDTFWVTHARCRGVTHFG